LQKKEPEYSDSIFVKFVSDRWLSIYWWRCIQPLVISREN